MESFTPGWQHLDSIKIDEGELLQTSLETMSQSGFSAPDWANVEAKWRECLIEDVEEEDAPDLEAVITKMKGDWGNPKASTLRP